MSDIKRLGLSGSADYATAVKRYGGGGDKNRPELGRWCFIFNNSTTDIPLFEKTDAEMLAMYNNISSVSTVAFQTGQYAQYNNNNGTTTLYNNTAVMETVSGAPCWSPATPSQPIFKMTAFYMTKTQPQTMNRGKQVYTTAQAI